MMNILAQLWYGNLSLGGQGAYWTQERRELLELNARNTERLSATLNDDEKDRLEKIQDCYLQMQQHEQCNAFMVGFRLAVRIMAASMAELPDAQVF